MQYFKETVWFENLLQSYYLKSRICGAVAVLSLSSVWGNTLEQLYLWKSENSVRFWNSVAARHVFPCYHSGYQTPVRSLSVRLRPTLNCRKSFFLYDHTEGETILELHQLFFDFRLCEWSTAISPPFYFLQPRAQQGPHLWLQLLGNAVIQTINYNLY